MNGLPVTREELISRTNTGESFEYFFFWGHTPPKDGGTNKSCLSQWFPAPFTVDGVTYKTAEHWMMAEKARLFGDTEMLAEIIDAPDPHEAKALGRKVRNFDADIWSAKCFDIVVKGNVEKFRQNSEMRDFLLATGNTILVEAAPRDQIWGIGLGEHNERARDPAQWRGRNLLGFALTLVRARMFNLSLVTQIEELTRFAVFEPNDEPLWAQIRQTVLDYLYPIWMSGRLVGAEPSEAFFVSCGRGFTMTQEDVESGRVVVEVGIAERHPAEFCIYMIRHRTA